MRSLFTTVGPAVVVLVGFWIGVWWHQRRRRIKDPVDEGPVSPKWLNENVYRKDGDRD